MQATRFFKTLSVKEKSCIPRKSPEQVQQVKTSLSMPCKMRGIGKDVLLYGNRLPDTKISKMNSAFLLGDRFQKSKERRKNEKNNVLAE